MFVLFIRFAAILLLTALALPLSAFASAGITVSSSGASSYAVTGAAFDKVAAIELTITYDWNSLSNPRVNQGTLLTGALVAVNPNTPGVIRLAAVTTSHISGNGTLASVAFDSKGTSGGIISLSARLSALNGNAIPVLTSVANPGISAPPANDPNPPASASTPAPGTQSPQTGTPTAAPVFAGGIIVPAGLVQPGSRDERETIPEKAGAGEEQALPDPVVIASREPHPGKRPVSPETAKTRKAYTQQSVLERFREFRGERTPKALMALFEQDYLIGYRQEPPLALSDGKKTVKAIFIASANLKGTPDIAVSNASLVSLARHPDFTNTWAAELRPHKNGSEAAVTVSLNDFVMVLPVTIAPRAAADLDKSGRVTEEDFRLFLKRADAGKKQSFDLNTDGKRDYVDDYIFTANYIIATQNRGPEISR